MASPIADFGGGSPSRGPPKTILAPPPPPAPPPPATRNVKAASPGPGGRGLASPGPALGAPSRAPPNMGAPVVPQHRNEVLHKMLRGLEDDSLTVADVLGVLETELRSGAPSAAPLSEQFERYIGPLSEVSGPSSMAPKLGRGPEPLSMKQPLLGPPPNAMVPPSFNAGAGGGPLGGGGGGGGFSQRGPQTGGDKPSHIIMNCARCAVLEQQVKALAQSLSGLGARMFNWSLAHCRDNNERNGLWHLIVKYLQPVMTVDSRISETCSGLQAACGTAGHVPSESLPSTRKMRNNANASSPSRSKSPAPVWQPPGIAGGFARGGDASAPGGGQVRFAENALHQAAPPNFRDSQHHSEWEVESATASEISAQNLDSLPSSALQMRSQAIMPPGPSKSEISLLSHLAHGFVPPAEAVSVRFGASKLAKKLNGVYEMIPLSLVNDRPVYAVEGSKRCLVHLSDGTWAIKDGNEDDVDADVYAYVRDDAMEPHKISQSWHVAADEDGFVLDTRGGITPGRSETNEAIEADSVKAAKLAGEYASAGTRAENGLLDREDREELQRFRTEAYRKRMEENAILEEQKEKKLAEKNEKQRKEDLKKRVAERVPKLVPAKLKITIVKALGLKSADFGGKADPYVICEVPRVLEKTDVKEALRVTASSTSTILGKTPVKKVTLKPEWNHVILHNSYKSGDALKFTVFDFDAVGASSKSKDDNMGEAVIKADRFYPGGFRGELALKKGDKDLKATLEVTVDVLETEREVVEPLEGEKDLEEEKVDPQLVPSEHLTELQRKLEAAVAREEVLKEKLETEKAARVAAEEDAEAALKQALKYEQGHYDYEDDDYDYDHEGHEEDPALVGHLHEHADDDPEIAEYRKAFNQFDKDKSGTISIDELKVIMEGLGRPAEADELKVLLGKYDASGDDGLDFHEFLTLLDGLNEAEDMYGPKLAKYQAMFKQFDVNRDGSISTDELQTVLDATGKSYDKDQIDKLMDEFDESNDGRVDFAEFLKLIEKLEGGNLKKGPLIAMDLTKVADTAPRLAPSDRKRVKAFLKRKDFPEMSDLAQAVNQRRKFGGFSKKQFEYPLHVAAKDNNPDMVWLLLESGADREIKNSEEKTAYEVTLKADNGKGAFKKVLELLQPIESEVRQTQKKSGKSTTSEDEEFDDEDYDYYDEDDEYYDEAPTQAKDARF